VTAVIDIDVIIVNYRTPELTALAVQYVTGPGVRLYVVDNSCDLPAELDEQVTELIRPGRNTYFAAGNNLAYARGTQDLVLLLNPDVKLSYGSLHKLAAHLVERPDCWAAAPRLTNPDGSTQNYLHRLPTAKMLIADQTPGLRKLWSTDLDRYYYRDLTHSRQELVEQPPAACLLLRRQDVGPTLFDERLRLFFNDTLLCWRMRPRRPLYVPSVTAEHVKAESLRRASAARPGWIRVEYLRSLLRYSRITGMAGRTTLHVALLPAVLVASTVRMLSIAWNSIWLRWRPR